MTTLEKYFQSPNFPSTAEDEHFREILNGGPHNLVMVRCLFEGRERVAIGSVSRVDKELQIKVLAILTHEKDDVLLPTKTGELVPSADTKVVFN